MLCSVVYTILTLLPSRYLFLRIEQFNKSDPLLLLLLLLLLLSVSDDSVWRCSCVSSCTNPSSFCPCWIVNMFICFLFMFWWRDQSFFWVGVIMNALHASERVGIWWLLTSLRFNKLFYTVCTVWCPWCEVCGGGAGRSDHYHHLIIIRQTVKTRVKTDTYPSFNTCYSNNSHHTLILF